MGKVFMHRGKRVEVDRPWWKRPLLLLGWYSLRRDIKAKVGEKIASDGHHSPGDGACYTTPSREMMILNNKANLGQVLANEMVEVKITDLPEPCLRGPGPRKLSGVVRFPESERKNLHNIQIHFHGNTPPERINGIVLTLWSIPPEVMVFISNSNQTVTIGRQCRGEWIFRMWGESSVEIGDQTTSQGTESFINWGGRLSIGRDCMFAAGTLLLVGDNHAIFDINTQEIVNLRESPQITIEDHVWAASRSTIVADSHIGRGSILATGSVTKGQVEPFTLVGGVPSKTLKQNVSWTRSYLGEDAERIAMALSACDHSSAPAFKRKN